MKTSALNMDSATGQNTPAKVPSVRPDWVSGSEMLPNSTYPAGSAFWAEDAPAADWNRLPNWRISRDEPWPLAVVPVIGEDSDDSTGSLLVLRTLLAAIMAWRFRR